MKAPEYQHKREEQSWREIFSLRWVERVPLQQDGHWTKMGSVEGPQ